MFFKFVPRTKLRKYNLVDSAYIILLNNKFDRRKVEIIKILKIKINFSGKIWASEL